MVSGSIIQAPLKPIRRRWRLVLFARNIVISAIQEQDDERGMGRTRPTVQ